MAIENFILITGSMKSGTTTLFDQLAKHPAIAPVHPKEPGFFAFPHMFARGFAWYESLIDWREGEHTYALDGSTDYSQFPLVDGVAARLKAASPRKFKLIYVMRHPLRRIESHARHTEVNKMEIGRVVSDQIFHHLDAGVSDVNVLTSCYAHQLDQFADWHESGDIFYLTLEDYKADPAAMLARLADFLDLPAFNWHGAEDVSNERRQPLRTPGYVASLKALPGVQAVSRFFFSPATRERLRKRLRRPMKVEGRFTLTEGEEAQILHLLRHDLARLESHYGVDVAKCWGIDTASLLKADTPPAPLTLVPANSAALDYCLHGPAGQQTGQTPGPKGKQPAPEGHMPGGLTSGGPTSESPSSGGSSSGGETADAQTAAKAQEGTHAH